MPAPLPPLHCLVSLSSVTHFPLTHFLPLRLPGPLTVSSSLERRSHNVPLGLFRASDGGLERPQWLEGARSRDFTDPLKEGQGSGGEKSRWQVARDICRLVVTGFSPFPPAGLRHRGLPLTGIMARNRIRALAAAHNASERNARDASVRSGTAFSEGGLVTAASGALSPGGLPFDLVEEEGEGEDLETAELTAASPFQVLVHVGHSGVGSSSGGERAGNEYVDASSSPRAARAASAQPGPLSAAGAAAEPSNSLSTPSEATFLRLPQSPQPQPVAVPPPPPPTLAGLAVTPSGRLVPQ